MLFSVSSGEPVAAASDAQATPDALPKPSTVLIAGGIAGIASRTATAPLDRLKTLMQACSHAAGGPPPRVDARSHACAQVGPPSGVRRPMVLGGVPQGLREIYRAGGLLSFWQGNGANCIKIVPESAIKFWAYDYVKRQARNQHARTACGRVRQLLPELYVRTAAGVCRCPQPLGLGAARGGRSGGRGLLHVHLSTRGDQDTHGRRQGRPVRLHRRLHAGHGQGAPSWRSRPVPRACGIAASR